MLEKRQMIFKRFAIIFVINCVINLLRADRVYGWKPIPGPPAAFTITQSHPPLGATAALVQPHPSSLSSSVAAAAQQQQQQQSQHILRNSINNDVVASGGSERSFVTTILDNHNSQASNIGLADDAASAAEFINNDHDIDDDIISADYKRFKTFNTKSFSSTGFDEDTCSVNKYAFDHIGTITYKTKIPKLDQFTICFWMRFTNHSGDHTIFTYSVRDEPREIQVWIANSKGSSFVSLAIHGQSLYRLNYPMKMRVWHHTCTSWNGKTGEWQLWIKAERVGRGFHNRLVNHKIPTGGIAFSGGPSVTGPVAEGLHFELTLLQIYKVALTAGKAHRNHKHHHVHRFNHDGLVTTTAPPPPPPQPQQIQMMNPLLVNGQIATRLQINLARPSANQQQPQAPSVPGIPSQVIGGALPGSIPPPQMQATITTNFVNGQFNPGSRLITQQLLASGGIPSSQSQSSQDIQPNAAAFTFPSSQLINPSSSQYIDDIDAATGNRFIFKRDSSTNEKSISKREISKTKNATEIHNDDDDDNDDDGGRKVQKRGLIALNDGTIIDDALLAHGYQFEGLAQFGLPDFKRGLQFQMNIEDEVKEHDKEPAEEEVKAVMNLCTACDIEPFKGAIAFAWKNAIISQEHTLKGRSVGGCGYF